MNLETYQKLKRNLDSKQREYDRAEGQVEIALESVKEFGCASLEEAQKLLKKLLKQKQQIETELTEKLEALETKWEGKL